MRRVVLAGIAFTMLAAPVVAETQKPTPCLTDSEAQALFTFMIPEAIEGVSKKCSASLPKTAFLQTQSAETITRFRTAAANSWPTAKAAFLKLSGAGDEVKVLADMPDSSLQPFVAAAFSQIIAKDIKPTDCPKINRLVAALAPLPTPNVAELITALMALVGTKENDDFRLC